MDEYLLNDLLECSVCLERLDTSSKVLPCQHTFCKKCLAEIVAIKRELRCPECRILVNTPIDELPPNVLLMRILEGMRHAGNPLPKKKSSAIQKTTHTPVHVPTSAPNCQFVPNVVESPSSRQHSIPKGHNAGLPMARALYDYQSLEPVDLNFKKGELITLKSKIDTHWAQGECSGRVGIFPLTFVQILSPLPPQVATCRALYDFRMNNDEVEGCLSFRKDEVLAVIRRVDENWIEGRLGGRTGIFPLAFVELNPVARNLMKLSLNEQPGPSRLAPPTPTSDESTPLIAIEGRISSGPQTQPPDGVILAPAVATPVSRSSAATLITSPPTSAAGPPAVNAAPTTTGSDSSSTSTTTPVTSSSGSSSSSTEPSSPASPQAQAQQQTQTLNPFMRPQTILLPTSHITTTQNRDKRHSFTALTSSHPPPTTNRHSAEILSCEESSSSHQNGESGQTASGQTPRESSLSPTALTDANQHASLLVRQGSQRHRKSDSDFALVVLPAAYVALYPYKPQKPDELELKKGGVYLVTERCQDGWFKGTSNRTQKCGVFPGNYVTLAKPAQNSHSRVVSSSPRESSSTPPAMVVKSKSPAAGLRPAVLNSLAPPELPPRSASPALRPHRQQWTFPSPPVQKPVAEETSSDVPTGPAPAVPSKSEVTPTSRSSHHVSNTVSPPPNVSVSQSPMSPKAADKIKEKKEKCGLMKRLAAIKRSKSPTLPAYSMDNPVFEDSSVPNSSNAVHSVHSRSGSCPSQLMQMPVGGSQAQQRLQSSSLSARVTRHKERPAMAAAHFSHAPRSSENGAGPVQMAGSHRKSSSLDAGDPRSPKPLVPSVRERFRCIVAYPPNSDYELELRVGDIIYVHRKREDGWYKGTQQRTGRTGLFPASFVETY